MRAALLFFVFVFAASLVGCTRRKEPPPAPSPQPVVVVPLGWKRVNLQSGIPPEPLSLTGQAPGAKYHRVPLATAEVLIDDLPPDHGEMLMLASFRTKGPVTDPMLDGYAAQIANEAGKELGVKKTFMHAPTKDRRGKLLVTRVPDDGRAEIHYLSRTSGRRSTSFAEKTRQRGRRCSPRWIEPSAQRGRFQR